MFVCGWVSIGGVSYIVRYEGWAGEMPDSGRGRESDGGGTDVDV